MRIQIAGPGCSRCQATEKVVNQVCSELNLHPEIEHVYDVLKFTKLGVRLTPAVLIDGKVVVSGRVPAEEELKDILKKSS